MSPIPPFTTISNSNHCSAVTEEMIDAVRLLIEADPHITYQQIESSLEINLLAIYLMLHDHVKLKRLCLVGTESAHKRSKVTANSILLRMSDEI